MWRHINSHCVFLTGRSYNSDTEDVRVLGRRKSTPNLFTLDTDQDSEVKRTPSFTYEDLYQKQVSDMIQYDFFSPFCGC